MRSRDCRLCWSDEARSVVICRRGIAISNLLLTLLSFSVLATVAMVVTPRYLSAHHLGQARVARNNGHQLVIEGMARLMGGSQAVLAVHPRGNSPFVEVVLWLEDSTNPGVVDRHELVVVGHSRVLRTLTAYQMVSAGEAQQTCWLPEDAALQTRTFCDQWRADGSVRPRVIGTGISDMLVERIGESGINQARYAITLTWAEDSADGPDEATLIVDAMERPRPAQE